MLSEPIIISRRHVFIFIIAAVLYLFLMDQFETGAFEQKAGDVLNKTGTNETIMNMVKETPHQFAGYISGITGIIINGLPVT